MRRQHLAWTLALQMTLAAASAALGQPTAVSLRTVEGRVVEVRTNGERGEGELELLTVRLETTAAEAPSEELIILLAPGAICEELGFDVEAGDRLRARIFVGEEGPARAQKALNVTRGLMVRFRTLKDMPLWTARGVWQGGPSRMAPAAGHGPRHRGGGPPQH